MDFKESIQLLSDKIQSKQGFVANEETTKNAFVLPLISALGYDIFDPCEVVPEMDCDLGYTGDKIDYAVMRNGQPILLIECKSSKTNLNLHQTQLAKYYAASNARFGVLTNGIEYRFYADLNKSNIMDETPFFVLNMLSMTDAEIQQLKLFHKSYFDENHVLSEAMEYRLQLRLKALLDENIKSPSTEFVRFFVKELNSGKSNSKLIEQYTPLIRRAFTSLMSDIVTGRVEEAVQPDSYDNKETDSSLQSFIDAVMSVLRPHVGKPNSLSLAQRSQYISIYYEKDWRWVCRLSVKPTNKRICFPNENYHGNEWVNINSPHDILSFQKRLIDSLTISQNAH